MAERKSHHGRREPSDEELDYQAQVLADVDAELAAQGGDVFDEIGAHAFVSYSKGRRGGLRKYPAEVVLVRDKAGTGFRQVRLGRVDGALDDVAHHALCTIPEEDRYQRAEEAISARLRGR